MPLNKKIKNEMFKVQLKKLRLKNIILLSRMAWSIVTKFFVVTPKTSAYF